jgi:DNA-directed RNA polymerase subunit H (RpoH/RPB5)
MSEVGEISKSRKYLLEIMESQGFNVDEYAYFSDAEVQARMESNQLDMLLELKDDHVSADMPRKKVYVRYLISKTLKPDMLDKMVSDLFSPAEGEDNPLLDKTTDTLFVVCPSHENESMIQHLKHLWSLDGIFVVIQSIKGLQYNLLKHAYVPTHRVLTDSETAQVMKQYSVANRRQFAEISRFDPVAKVLCMRPEQVCHIIRSSKTSITTDYYRVCI